MSFAKVYRYVPVLAAAAALVLAAPAARAHDDDGPRVRVGLHIGDGFGLFIGHRHRQRCIAGHYETREERVCVEPERCERRWVPAVYETRYGRHRRCYQVCVREGYYEEYRVPARYECRTVRVWVPERYVCD